MEKYRPKIHDEGNWIYVEMLLEAKKCNSCQKIMIDDINNAFFPKYFKLNRAEQMIQADMVYTSSVLMNGKLICVECEKKGKANFLCYLCNKTKTSEKVHESFGYPTDYLCSDCYETVPAKKWNEVIDELNEDHKYDFNV